MIVGSMSPNLVAVTVSQDGKASAPAIVTSLPFLYGLASDGDHFFLRPREAEICALVRARLLAHAGR